MKIQTNIKHFLKQPQLRSNSKILLLSLIAMVPQLPKSLLDLRILSDLFSVYRIYFDYKNTELEFIVTQCSCGIGFSFDVQSECQYTINSEQLIALFKLGEKYTPMYKITSHVNCCS